MKYKDPITGEFKDITIKAGDTLPVGAILEFDGDVIPAGYEEVTDEVDQKEVFVGPDEPTTGEEVWLQKGKNLFDKYNFNKLNAYIDPTTSLVTLDENNCMLFIKCSSNTTYAIQKIVSVVFSVGYTNELPKGGVQVYGLVHNAALSNTTITTGDNAKYIVVRYYHKANDTKYTEQQTLDSIQIEQGETATDYEPYIDKKIYTKNDNGVYEEFYNEETIINSGVINGIHYIKFPDGTLIQRGNYSTDAINANSGYNKDINLPISFIDTDYAVNITKTSGGSSGFAQIADSCARNTEIIYFTHWNFGDGTAAALSYSWTAIGRWK